MVTNTNLRNLNQQEIDIQHVTDYCRYARLRLNPVTGTLLIRAIGGDGEVTHRELFDYEQVDFSALHDGNAWYLPEVERILGVMDEHKAGVKAPELPGFVHRHYAKGRSLV